MVVNSKRPRLNGVVNRINLVGVELEGGWDKVPTGEQIQPDGSVKFKAQIDQSTLPPEIIRRYTPAQIDNLVQQGLLPRTSLLPQFTKGEIVSKPLSIDKTEKWITHAYPQHINETCGLHVHVSFVHHINYSRLMVPEFIPYMVSAVREWATTEGLPKNHPQWNRLDPDHPWTLEHCSHVYLGDAQVKMKKKDWHSRGTAHSRYTFVNYCGEQHKASKTGTGTIEIRGLSMPPKAEQAHRAVLAVVDATNRFLSKLRQRERTERIVIKARPEPEMHYGRFINNY